MNIDTGEIIKGDLEEIRKRIEGGEPLVPLPDDPDAIDAASRMNRKQRRRYQILVNRRGRTPDQSNG